MTVEVESALVAEPPAKSREHADVFAARRGTRWAGAATYLLRRPGLVLSLAWLVLVLLATVAPDLFTGRDPLSVDPTVGLRGPSWHHLFGTDELGRDLFSRTVYGTRRTVPAALLATVIGLVAGSILGMLAGFLRSWTDAVIMRIVDVLLSIPGLLLALMLIAILGEGDVGNVAVAIGVAAIASTARVMRAEVLRVRESVFVEAAHSGGARWHRVLLRHVLPNSMGPVWAMTVLLFGVAILGVTTLSFLGFGVQAPTPEWGSLVSSGRNYLRQAWWMSILPGLVIAATVIAANRISRAFDDGVGRP